jgi:hypothetical protein
LRVIPIPCRFRWAGDLLVDIAFTPPAPGQLRPDLHAAKGGKEQFHDSRVFAVE